MFLSLIRNRHLFQFKLRKPDFDPSIEGVFKLRIQAENAARYFGKLPKNIQLKPVDIGGIYAEWVLPHGADPKKVMLYFHGGGYVVGSAQGHRLHTGKFVKATGIPALVFNYRLAPEHPFPAAVEDSLNAYKYLLDKGSEPANIVFMGDSAGGGLCLATLLAIKMQGLPLPAAAVALSPWVDLKCTGDSYTTKASVCLSPEGSWDAWGKMYFGDHSPEDPLVSPLYGDLKGLPPLLIIVGGDEILLDDSREFAKKAEVAGVDVTLIIGEGMCHCYPAFANILPEAKQALASISTFVKSSLEH